MPEEFQYDAFLSHSAKDKTVVRPLAERLPRGNKSRQGRKNGSDVVRFLSPLGMAEAL